MKIDFRGKSFGEKIRDMRVDRDMSQAQVAKLIPMNQSNYSKIERGAQEPDLYQLKRIAEIFSAKAVEFARRVDELYIEFYKKV